MDIFDDIKNRIDLVEFVSEHVRLKKTGRTMTGLCPFHSERTPSFVVYPDKKDYHCFGCGAHGTVIDYVMQQESVGLWEAVELLADRLGIPINDSEEYKQRKAEYIKREQQAKKYHKEVSKAADYLKGRGITGKTAKEFCLGWDESKQAVIIPLHDKYGRTAGHAERLLNPVSNSKKYWNSFNDQFFKKGETLYNVHRARKHSQERLYIVEGYFDVMSMWQMGYENVVGMMNQTLTNDQAQLIRSITNDNTTVTLIPDNDEHQLTVVQKNTSLLRRFCKNHITVIQLPDGCKDANDALIENKTEWQEESADLYLLKNAMEAEPNQEKQYISAKKIADQAANDMVKADMVDYLAELWGKDRKLVRDYIGTRQDTNADKINKLVRLDKLVESYSEYVANENKNIVTIGYPKLNKALNGGVRPGEVLQYIARSGVGKTTWLVNVIMRILEKQRIPIIFFSLEQQKEPIFEIMMQILLGAKANEVKYLFRDKLLDSVHKQLEKIKENFIIVDEGGLTLKEIEDYVRTADMHIFDQPSRAIFIDYMGYIKGDKSASGYDRTTSVAKELKEFAKRINKAVFSLHQTSRDGKGGWTQVEMTMARDSGAVEESADYMLGGWRPGLNPDLSEEEKEAMKEDYLMAVLKNRRGPTNTTFRFKYYAETRRIYE